jgi:hypothetical protein
LATLRSELKFYISDPYAVLLESRLKKVMICDPHAVGDSSYRISSLYFDSPGDSAFLDKINGLGEREKFRIRFYNNEEDYIRLEKKKKNGSQSMKTSVVVPKAFAKSLADCHPMDPPFGDGLIREFSEKIRYFGYRPAVFVHYLRKAYLFPAGNVRITFDSCLQAARFTGDLFSSQSPVIPLLSSGLSILEVKFDSFLPPFLSQLLVDIPKSACAISKYCLCRESVIF